MAGEDSGLLASLQEKWEDFLDWSDEHGLPMAQASDWLETHGIPSLPVFLLLLLLIIGAIVFVAYPLVLPQNGSLQVTVLDSQGNPLQGATVRLASIEGEPAFSLKTQLTDSAGVASFDGLPHSRVQVTASYEGHSDASENAELVSAKQTEVQLTSIESTQKTVSVSLEISGPTDPDKVTTTLFDDLWNPIATPSTGFKPVFNVNSNTTFQAKISAPGFSEKVLTGQYAGESDKILGSIALVPIPTARTGTVRVFVHDLSGNAIANASVVASEADTGKQLFSAFTGDDGRTPPTQAALGTRALVKASAQSYATKASDAVAVTQDTQFDLALRKLEGPQPLGVTVVDSAGNFVQSPLVRLYSKGADGRLALLQEEHPLEERVEFQLEQNAAYALTAYAPGYLAQYAAQVTPGEKKITLSKATPANSAKLRVHASSFDGSDASGAGIALFAADRTPLGLGEKTTGPDGIQFFDDVALGGDLIAAASSQGRYGESRTRPASANSSVEVILSRGAGSVKVVVKDRFSHAGVKGAVAKITGLNETTCTTNEKGECSVQASEFAGASATISANGYDSFVSSGFDIKPNTESRVEAQLFPSAVASTTKLEFEGFFGLDGNRVTQLAPATAYTARFVMRSPPIDYSSATAFFSLGDPNSALDATPAAITGFDAPGSSRSFAGTDFEDAKKFVAQETSSNSSAGAAATNSLPGLEEQAANNPNAREFKWVEFIFDKFAASKEISLSIRTKPVAAAKTGLNYRSAFAATGSTVRNPVDADAGVTKSALLANTLREPIGISFEGSCAGELCVQAFFETSDGRQVQPGGLGAGVGEQFTLKVRALSFNQSLSARAETNGIALGLLRGQSGGSDFQPSATPDGGASVLMPLSNGAGSFFLRGQRVSADGLVKLTLLSAGGATVYEKTFSVRVNSQGNPALAVQATPLSIVALAPATVTFTVRDGLGLPVTGALVTLGGVADDAFGRIEQATEASNKPGTYVAQNVVAERTGTIAYSIDGRGFATARGSIPVTARDIVSVNEKSLLLSVDGQGGVKTAPLTINNLLDNEVFVSLSITRDRIPQVLDLQVTPSTQVRLPGKGVLNAALSAGIADFVLGLAQREGKLDETINGRVRISASVAGARQGIEVPFTARATVVQHAIDGVWAVDKADVQVTLAPPNNSQQTVQLRIANSGPHPLLINEQADLSGVFIDPPSLQIAPGETGLLNLVARSPSNLATGSCVFKQDKRTGTLSLYASFQGITSSKRVPVTIETIPAGKCMPQSPVPVILPLAVRYSVPQDAQVRPNDDGSTTAQLADGTRMVFSSAAARQGNVFEAPAGTETIFDAKQVTQSAATGASITLPVQASLVIPASIPVVPRNGKSAAIAGGTQIIFPTGLALSQETAVRSVRLPAGTVLQVQPLAPPELGASPLAAMPVKTTFSFGPGSVLQESADGSFAVTSQDGSAVGFKQTARHGAVSNDGSVEVTVDAGDSVLLPPADYALTATRGIELRPPVKISLEVASDAEVVTRQGSVVAFLADYDLQLPPGTSFAPSAGGKTASVIAGSRVLFNAVDGRGLAGNAFASLPVALKLVIPPDARIDETSAGKIASFGAGETIGLPPDAQVGERQLDGTRIATVPAFSQVSLPQPYLPAISGGGFVLKPGINFAVGVPQGTRQLEQGGDLVYLLSQFDLHIPKSTAFGAEGSNLFSQTLQAGTPVKLLPVQEISLAGLRRVVLPFDLNAQLPEDARLVQRADGIAVRLSDGTTLGFSSPAQLIQGNAFGAQTAGAAQAQAAGAAQAGGSGQGGAPVSGNAIANEFDGTGRGQPVTGNAVANAAGSAATALGTPNVFATSVNAPAGTAILLPASSFDNSGGPTTKITLPYAASLAFDPSVQLLREESRVSFAGDDFTASASSARVEGTSGALRATLNAGTLLEIRPAVTNLVGDELSLPVELDLSLPQGALVRQRPDGRTFVQAGGFSGLFAVGASAAQGVFTVPENTPVVFAGGLATPLRPRGFGTTQDFRLVLPVAYSIVAPANAAKVISTTSGRQAIEARGFVIELPPAAQITQSTDSIRASVPSGAAVNFVREIAGIPASGVTAVVAQQPPAQLTAQQKIALAAADNIVLVLPFQLEATVTPDLKVSNADETGGGPAVFLSDSRVIAFGATAQLSKGALAQIVAPPGTQISLPADLVTKMPDGGYSFTLPLAGAIDAPADAQIFTDRTTHIVLEQSRQEVQLPAGTAFIEAGEFMRAEIQPGAAVAVGPISRAQLQGLVPARLPVDVELLLSSGARAFTQGTATTVRFADGRMAQFPGTVATDTTLAGARLLPWSSGTNALLESQMVSGQGDYGGLTVTLPTAANIILPSDARIVSRGSLTAVIPSLRQQILLPAGSRPVSDKRGFIVQVAAGGRIISQPFGLDVQGFPLVVPFEIQLGLPPGALVDENAPGGVVVDFFNGVRAKFSGGAITSSPATLGTNLAAFNGIPQGFYSPAAMTPFAGRTIAPYPAGFNGNGFSFPQGYSGFDAFGAAGAIAPGLPASPSQGSFLIAPAYSQLTLSPLLARPLAIGPQGFGPMAYEFSLPAAWTAVPQSESAIYNNPDGSFSIFVRDYEVVFPPGTFPSPFARFGGGVGAQQLLVPAFAPVRVLPVYSGLIAGERRSLPFEFVLELPPQARVLPLAPDGTRTVDFGGAGRVLFTKDLQVDERVFRPGAPLPPQLGEVVVAQGTPMVFSPGLLVPLPPELAGLAENGALATDKRGFTLRLPASMRIRVPGEAREAKNDDGTRSVFLADFELRLPPGVSAPLQEGGGSALKAYRVPAGVAVHVVPIVFADAFQRVEINLPFDLSLAIPPNARVLPKAPDESWAIEFPGRGSLAFRGETALGKDGRISLPGGTSFYPSRELVALDKKGDAFGNRATTFKVTLPVAAQLKTDFEPQPNNDGTKSLFSGSQELVIPQSGLVAKQGNAFIVTLLPFSVLTLKPIDAAAGQNLQDIFLPGDAVFALPAGAKAYPESVDGTRVVKFATGQAIVFRPGATLTGDGSDRKVSVPMGIAFAPSYGLLQMPRPQVIGGAIKPPSQTNLQAWRFSTPATLTISLPKDARVATLAGGYSVQGDFEEHVLPLNARQVQTRDKGTQFVLAQGMVVEYKPLDFGKENLVEISLPVAASLTIPAGSRELVDAKSQEVHYLLPGGEKVVFPQGAPKTVRPGGEIVFKLEAGTRFNVPSGWVASSPDGSAALKYASRWSFQVDKDTTVQQVGNEYEVRFKADTSISPTGYLAARMQVRPGVANEDISTTARVIGSIFNLKPLAGTPGSGNLLVGGAPAGVSLPNLPLPEKLPLAPKLFPNQPNNPNSQAPNRNYFVIIPANTNVRFILSPLKLEDIAGSRIAELKFTLGFAGYVEVDGRSEIKPQDGGLSATFPGCQTVTVVDSRGAKPRIEQRDSVAISITNARQENPSTGAANPAVNPSTTKRLVFSPGAQLTLKACATDDVNWRYVKMWFPSELTFELPQDTVPNPVQAGEVTFGPSNKPPECRPMKTEQNIEVSVPLVDRIDFGGVPANGRSVDKRPAVAQPRFYLNAEHEVRVAICEDAAKSGPSQIGPGVYSVLQARFVNPTPAAGDEAFVTTYSITLDDGNRKADVTVAMKNGGSVPVTVDLDKTKLDGTALEAYGAYGSQGKDTWWKSYYDAAGTGFKWLGGVQKAAGQVEISPTTTGDFANIFQTSVSLPRSSQFVNPLTNCVDKEGKLEGDLEFHGFESSTKNGVKSNKIHIIIVIKKNEGKCIAAKQTEQLLRSGFYATHALEVKSDLVTVSHSGNKLSFKAPEATHVRYFAVVNNFQDDNGVLVTPSWPDGQNADCTLVYRAKSFDTAASTSDASAGVEELKLPLTADNPFELARGGVGLVKCVPSADAKDGKKNPAGSNLDKKLVLKAKAISKGGGDASSSANQGGDAGAQSSSQSQQAAQSGGSPAAQGGNIFQPSQATAKSIAQTAFAPVETVATLELNVFNPEAQVYSFYKEAGTPLGTLCPDGENLLDSKCTKVSQDIQRTQLAQASAAGAGAASGAQTGTGVGGLQEAPKCDGNVALGKCWVDANQNRADPSFETKAMQGLICKQTAPGSAAFVPATDINDKTLCCGAANLMPAEGSGCQKPNSIFQNRQTPQQTQAPASQQQPGLQNPAPVTGHTIEDSVVQAAPQTIQFQSAPQGGTSTTLQTAASSSTTTTLQPGASTTTTTTGTQGAATTPPGQQAPAAPQQNAPQTTVANAKPESLYYTLCEEYFCSKDQVLSSFASVSRGYYEIIQDVRDNAKTGGISGNSPENTVNELNALDQLSKQYGGVIRRAFVVQKAGGDKISDEEVRKAVTGAFAGESWAPGTSASNVQSQGVSQMDSCGVYLVQAEFKMQGLGFLSVKKAEDALQQTQLSFRVLKQKDAGCPENLANGALLMGPPARDAKTGALTNTDIWTGRRVVDWTSFSSNELYRAKKLLSPLERWKEARAAQANNIGGTALAALSFPSVLALGPYGEEYNLKDAVIAKNMYRQMFRSEPGRVPAIKAVSYNDAGYCAANGFRQLGTVSVAAGAGTALVAGVTGLLGVTGNPFAAGTGIGTVAAGIFAQGTTRALTSCAVFGAPIGVGAGVVSANAGAGVCEGFNACIFTAIASGFTGGGTAPKSGVGTLGALKNAGESAGSVIKEQAVGSRLLGSTLFGLGFGAATGLSANAGQNTGAKAALGAVPTFYLGSRAQNRIATATRIDPVEFTNALKAKNLVSGSIGEAEATKLMNAYVELLRQGKPPGAATFEEAISTGGVDVTQFSIAGVPPTQRELAQEVQKAVKGTRLGNIEEIYADGIANSVLKQFDKELKLKGKIRVSYDYPPAYKALAADVKKRILAGDSAEVAIKEAFAKAGGEIASNKQLLKLVLSDSDRAGYETATAAMSAKGLEAQKDMQAANLPGDLHNTAEKVASAETQGEITRELTGLDPVKIRAEGGDFAKFADVVDKKKAGLAARTTIGRVRPAGVTPEKFKKFLEYAEKTVFENGETASDVIAGLKATGGDGVEFNNILIGLGADQAAQEATVQNYINAIREERQAIADFKSITGALRLVDEGKITSLSNKVRDGTATSVDITALNAELDRLEKFGGTQGAAAKVKFEEMKTARQNALNDIGAGTPAEAEKLLLAQTEGATTAKILDTAAKQQEARPLRGVFALRDPAVRQVFLKRIPITLGQLFLTLLFHVDVSPTHAEMQPGTNSLVASNYEHITHRIGTNYIASMHEYCVKKPDGSCETAYPLEGDANCSPDNGFAACADLKAKGAGRYGVLAVVNDRVEANGAASVNQQSENKAGTVDLGAVNDATGELSKASAGSSEEQQAELAVGTRSGTFLSSIFDPDFQPLKSDFGKLKIMGSATQKGG